MVYILGFVILIYFMLAIISRQHFSKYKGKGATAVFWAMVHTIYILSLIHISEPTRL